MYKCNKNRYWENVKFSRIPSQMKSKLKKQKPGRNGEIHITDSIQSLIDEKENFIAHNFNGKYLDCGTMHGYINSSIEISKV